MRQNWLTTILLLQLLANLYITFSGLQLDPSKVQLADFRSGKLRSRDGSTRDLETAAVVLASSSDENAPCRILIENPVEFHYEILESTIMQYPLPWTDLPCFKNYNDISLSAVYDVSLVAPRLSRLYQKFTGEQESWQHYFETTLQNTTRVRQVDNVTVTFGKVLRSQANNSAITTTAYDAVIHASCDFDDNHTQMLRDRPNLYCIMHRYVQDKLEANERLRACGLNPMHAPGCFFVPTVLPQFPDSPRPSLRVADAHSNNDATTTTTLNVCTSGLLRNHYRLAKALHLADFGNNTQFYLFHRIVRLPNEYYEYNVTDRIQLVRTANFIDFERQISHCHIMLPMIERKYSRHHNNYFTTGERKLSGAIPQAIAYRMGLLLHTEMYDIYKDYFTAPALNYTRSTTSFIEKLHELIAIMRQQAE